MVLILAFLLFKQCIGLIWINMKLQLKEQVRGVSVQLEIEIDAQALGLPCEAAQSDATFGLDRTHFADECLDRVHTELLQLLRQARYAAERSLVEYDANQIRASLAG